MGQPQTDRTGRIQRPGNGNGNGQPKDEGETTLLKQLLGEKAQLEIKRALPEHLSPRRMIRVAMSALTSTRYLAQCTPHTFFGCLIQAAQLGLEVNTPLGHAWLIPRRNKKLEIRLKSDKPIHECTLMIGYQGMIELSMRTDRVCEITAMAVRDGDYFCKKHGLNAVLDHEPSEDIDREQREITYVWALARLKHGGQPWVALNRAQIEARRARSASPNDGPWVTDYEAMACKSAIRALWKVLPKSPEMATAEHLELTAEAGRSQLSAFEPSVREAIERQGLMPLIDEDIEQASFDQVTGETTAGQSELMPAAAAQEPDHG